MIYNNFSKQINILNPNTYNRRNYFTNSISFSSSSKDVFIQQQPQRIKEPMYDNGTEIKNAIENNAKKFYNKKFTPPIALSNLIYHNMSKLGSWQLITDTKELTEKTLKAKEIFANEKLVPFAKSENSTQTAYFDVSSSTIVEKNGDIEIANYDSFEEWVFSTINSIFNSSESIEINENEFASLEDKINDSSERKFKCPKSYKQARTLNLTNFLERWTMPKIMDTDLINYSSGTIIPFACSDSGSTFAAFVNKQNSNQSIIVGTIYPKNRINYAQTKDDSLITILENHDSFEAWFKNQIQKMMNSKTY